VRLGARQGHAGCGFGREYAENVVERKVLNDHALTATRLHRHVSGPMGKDRSRHVLLEKLIIAPVDDARECGKLIALSLTPTEDMMAIPAHLVQLSQKHRTLDQRIAEERTRPAADEAKIAKLKLEKLRLKDQIARLESSSRH
jgi:hypothetical protein